MTDKLPLYIRFNLLMKDLNIDIKYDSILSKKKDELNRFCAEHNLDPEDEDCVCSLYEDGIAAGYPLIKKISDILEKHFRMERVDFQVVQDVILFYPEQAKSSVALHDSRIVAFKEIATELQLSNQLELMRAYHKASARLNEKVVGQLQKSFPRLQIGGYLNGIPYVRVASENYVPKVVQSYVDEVHVRNLRALPPLGFNQPNIVNFATFDASDMVVLIMDRHSASLAQHPRVHDSDLPRFDKLVGELLKGLSTMHRAGFAHTNVIRRNIRISEDGHAVLAGMVSVTAIGTSLEICSPDSAPEDISEGLSRDRFVASRELDLFMLAEALIQTISQVQKTRNSRLDIIRELMSVEKSVCGPLPSLHQLRVMLENFLS